VRKIAPLLFAALMLTACGSDEKGPIAAGTSATASVSTRQAATPITPAETPRPTPAPTPTPAPERPSASVEVLFVGVEPRNRVLRFAAEIRNMSSKTVEGMKAQWTATDEGGAIVGSFPSNVPPIGAGATYTYVGGAGSGLLTGVPKDVKLTITDSGRLTDAPPAQWLIEGIAFQKEAFSLSDVPEYTVTATITTPAQEIKRPDLVVTTVLKDSAGVIIGAAFDIPSGLPETLPPSTKFKAELKFVRAIGTPVTTEVNAKAVAR